jgi:predicted ferric reductase
MDGRTTRVSFRRHRRAGTQEDRGMATRPTERETSKPADGGHVPAGLSPTALFGGYALLGVAPLLLGWLIEPPSRSFWRELSGGLVMVAYAMTLMQFMLSGRLEWLSGRVGIDRSMRFHKVTAWVILAIVVAHPLLYAVPRLVPDPMDALDALRRMFASERLRSGVVAWWLMIAIVLLAALRDRLPMRYETWRLSHGLAALAIAGSGTHHTLAVGTYSSEPWLAAFWIVATTLAVLALLHVYLVRPLIKRRAPYRVVANRKVAQRMWELVIEPERGEGMSFAAGQFVWLNLGHAPFSLVEHPFSMSSAPAQRPRIAFTIKESGDFTGRIGAVAPGTRAYVDGPHGNFCLAGRDVRGLVFVAGGVGLAPVMSMLRQLAAERWPHPVRLIYGNRVEDQILYRDELEALKSTLDFDVAHVLSEPPQAWRSVVGMLTREVLDALLDSYGGGDWTYFLCGTPAMMTSVERALAARGVPRGRIVSERFSY